MKSIMFYIGILAGILLLIIISTVNKKFRLRDCGNIDERQRLARGKAYKYSFYTLVAYNALTCMGYETDIVNMPTHMFITMTGIFLSIIVYAITCIVNDAYLGLQENPGKVLRMFWILGGFNLIIGIIQLLNGEYTAKNGQILWDNLYPWITAVTILIIAVVLLIKTMHDDSETE